MAMHDVLILDYILVIRIMLEKDVNKAPPPPPHPP